MSNDKKDDLLKLCELRVKELHHYNTLVGFYPFAFAALLIAQMRFLYPDPSEPRIFFVPLMVAATFNFAFAYAFQRFVEDRGCIQRSLDKIEDQLEKHYEPGLLPDFSQRCVPT